jgi:hypothetical protein
MEKKAEVRISYFYGAGLIMVSSACITVGATKKLKDVLTSTEKRFKAARPIRKYLHIIFLKVGSQEKTTFDIPKVSLQVGVQSCVCRYPAFKFTGLGHRAYRETRTSVDLQKDSRSPLGTICAR